MEDNKELMVKEEKKNESAKSGFSLPIFFTILGVVTVICVVVGVSINFARFCASCVPNIVVGGGTAIDQTFEVEDADIIDMKIEIGNVEIKTGDKYEVSFIGGEAFAPVVEEKSGRLTISQKKNITLFPALEGLQREQIVLTIPSSKVIESFDIECDLGNLHINNVTAEDMKIECNLGNVEIDKLKVARKLSIAADCGNVQVGNAQIGELKAECDAGNITFADSTFVEGDIDADLGNVELYGSFGEIKGSCSLGNITVENDNESCEYDVATDLGNCKINGKDYPNGYKN